jgi:hypothetical protein
MPLAPGDRVGSCEIVGPLGAGGMGEVYRARDTRLGREVAIKILPPLFATDPERLARFEREARTLAALNHPHIAQIHGMEAGERGHALVMELVEGEDLSSRLARGPVPVPEAIAIAQQIADALEAAHEQGIVHRDLKPANIKVRDDGVVKLLDFGLAKAWAPESAGGDAMSSPTLTARATQLGMILGTAAYMAPEQARGKTVDRRADIWAFGVVLFETLTARRAFPGDDVTEVLAKIIEREPDLAALPASTPPGLRQLIARCVIKDPKLRLRDIGVARIALAETAPLALAAGPPPLAAGDGRARPPVWRRAAPWIASIGIAAVVLLLVLRPAGGTPAAGPVIRLQIALPPGVEVYTAVGAALTISPDASLLAFAGVREGVRQVYLRRLDGFDLTPVRGTETAVSCVFAPDGRELLVGLSDTSLRRVRLSDGLVQTVTASASEYLGGWLSNGGIVFSQDGRLWMSGGTPDAPPVQLTEPAADPAVVESQPVAVPGTEALLFTVGRPDALDRARIDALSIPGRVRTTVVERAASPLLTGTGHLLFLRDSTVFAAPFDARTLTLAGEAVPVLRDASIVRNRGASPILSVSATGVLVYSSTSAVQSEIVSVSRRGEERTLLTLDRPIVNPRMAPGGRWLLLEELGGGLWVQDFERRALSRVTDETEMSGFPILSPDGQQAVFRSPAGMSVVPLDGSAKPRQIAGTADSEFPSAFTDGGRELIYTKITAAMAGDLYAIPIAGGTPRVLLSTPAYEGGADVSPDGRWIVYVSNERGASEIFLQPYPAMDRRVQVSTQGGIHPRWHPQGGEIFYRQGERMMAVRMTTTPSGPSLSEPVALFAGRYAFGGGLTIPNYSVSADGEHFILVKERSGATLSVVLNWFEEFR